MLKLRTKRLAAGNRRAADLLAEIEASIKALDNEDLLDLADILRNQMQTALAMMACGEMTRRGISLDDAPEHAGNNP